MKSIVNFTAGCFCLFLALFNPGVGKMQSSIDETITQIVFNDNGSRIAVATIKLYPNVKTGKASFYQWMQLLS